VTTACTQQHIILDEQHRMVTSATGKVTPHPRQALIQDLSAQLREWRTDGLEIILSGDLNEVLVEDPSKFAKISSKFNLTNVYRFVTVSKNQQRTKEATGVLITSSARRPSFPLLRRAAFFVPISVILRSSNRLCRL
jgi:hypothetical protein